MTVMIGAGRAEPRDYCLGENGHAVMDESRRELEGPLSESIPSSVQQPCTRLNKREPTRACIVLVIYC